MNLVLTFDYELYGDGSGDIFREMIHPTNDILDICNKYQIKSTLFFEVIEYIKIRDQWLQGNTMGYCENPVKAIEEQLRNALKSGHDIQLHIHPQWVDAEYKNQCWNVNLEKWRLGDFNHENYTIKELIKEGKDVLEDLLKPVDPDYRCVAIRAGGYNIMPSSEVYKAMQELDLKLDSSVYPGGYAEGSLSRYDYRAVPLSKDYWICDKEDIRIDLKEEEEEEHIYEIPIFALSLPRWKKISILRLKSNLKKRRSSIKNTKTKSYKNSNTNILKFLLEREAITWDFCLFQMSLHKYFIKYIQNNLKDKRSSFVLIGHPKGFSSPRRFEKFIKFALKKEFTFCSLKTYYKSIINE